MSEGLVYSDTEAVVVVVAVAVVVVAVVGNKS